MSITQHYSVIYRGEALILFLIAFVTGLISLAPTSASAIEAGVYDFVTLPGDTITFYDTDSDGEVDAVRSKRLAAETKHSVLAQNWGGERQHMPVPQVHSPP